MKKVLFTSDSGHGWYRVSIKDLKGFKPSEYSYKDSLYAYLEEDCDFEGYLNHNNIDHTTIEYETKNVNGLSSIRNKDRFLG